MESTATRQKRVRRSESEIRTLLNEQEQSAVTVKEFCRRHNMHEQTFYNWRKKYSVKTEKPARFIPLQIGSFDTEASLFAEIELSDKIRIRLFRQVDGSYFKTLL